jgi:iron complex transport system substrate-binding protein
MKRARRPHAGDIFSPRLLLRVVWAPCLTIGLLFSPPASSAVTVIDDTGATVSLPNPARRIVSLVPHATELLFAAGAGGRVVGIDNFSDYPLEATRLPRVGGMNPDLEAIARLRPDLVVSWASYSPPWLVERLRTLGVAVYVSELRRLEEIPVAIERLGKLAATDEAARVYTAQWRRRFSELSRRAAGHAPVSVFYQIMDASLLTVSGEHLISDVIRLCGGRNVFADTDGLALFVDLESVLHRDPQVILAAGSEYSWDEWLARWRTHKELRAVSAGNLFHLPTDTLHRTGPRMLDGAERVCAILTTARQTAR